MFGIGPHAPDNIVYSAVGFITLRYSFVDVS